MTKQGKYMKQETTVIEGQEYRITANGRTVYEGIAESDQDAEQNLESYAMWIHSTWNEPIPLVLKIELI